MKQTENPYSKEEMPVQCSKCNESVEFTSEKPCYICKECKYNLCHRYGCHLEDKYNKA